MAGAGSDADGVQGAGLERGLRPALLLPHVLHHAGGADPPPCNTHPSALCPTRGLSIGTSQLDLTAAHTRWRAQVVNTGSLSGDCARNGLYKYSQNYWKDWTNSWMIWCALRKPLPALRLPIHVERGRENLRSQAAWVHGCLCHAAAPTDAVDR